ncbi:MAG: hypothetical protein MUC36_10670 [Planctomycetes bacterium]|jgi:hypothetical protein|nr:hypothetical protein [Planctomycetota bacterium]
MAKSKRVLSIVSMVLVASAVSAQCSNVWLSGGGSAGPDAQVNVMTERDPDGPGPLPPQLVCGGYFASAGGISASNIASWEPVTATWSPLGSGIPGRGVNSAVFALATLPNGDVIAGGYFAQAGGVFVSGLARWDGSAWSAFGGGSNGGVFALAVMPNGDLIAGGRFTSIGGIAANRIARWNGTQWSPFGSGVNDDVMTLLVMPNGDVVAGGRFTSAGSLPVGYVARWNGVSWSSLNGGCDNQVRALAAMPNGDLAVGGLFSFAGGVLSPNLARWNGSTWASFGSGVDDWVLCLASLPNGDLVAGGFFDVAGGTAVKQLARWNGTSWSRFVPAGGLTSGTPNALLVMSNGTLVVGGNFWSVDGTPADHVAIWTGSNWLATAAGTNAPVYALASLDDGSLLAGGVFQTIGGVPASAIARRVGGVWSPLGSGVNATFGGQVYTIAAVPGGGAIVGGAFSSAGGIAVNNIARWNGTAWSPLGPGLSGVIHAVVVMPNGDVVAGGNFTQPAAAVARWNGSSWSGLGGGLSSGIFFQTEVADLAVLPNGDLVATGTFQFAGGLPVNNIARWDGSAWHALGGGLGGGLFNTRGDTLLALRNGDVVVGGNIFVGTSGNVARWNGTAWSGFGTGLAGTPSSMVELPNGDLVMGGFFATAGGLAVNNIARWNGSNWAAIGSGTAGPTFNSGVVAAMVPTANGDLVLGGDFTRAGGQVSVYLAELSTTCPAAATLVGNSCAGAQGPIRVQALTLPWTGSRLRTRGTGWAAPAITAVVSGFGALSLPLAPALPAAANCSLLVTPDAVELALASTSSSEHGLTLPNSPALAGTVLYQQWLPFELDAQGGIAAVAASATLRCVVGAF